MSAALTMNPRTTKFRAVKLAAHRWAVVRYIGTDVLGAFHFEPVSQHGSKVTARREADRLNAGE